MLRCITPYRAVVSGSDGNRIIAFAVGDTVDDAALAEWLLNDAPEAFEPIERALDAAPADRMVRKAGTRRAG